MSNNGGITLGSIQFNYLSGPLSISMITPSKSLLKISSSLLPPILFLGDQHNSTQDNCGMIETCKTKKVYTEDEPLCMSTNSALWYRALDSLSSDQAKVDVYLELGFYPYFLKHPTLFDESRYKDLFETNQGMITYIPRFHTSCLSTIDEIQKKCLTRHIRYHLSDLRYEPGIIHFTPNEVDHIERSNKMVKDPSNKNNLQTIYNTIHSSNSVNSVNSVNSKIHYRSKLVGHPDHLPTFESLLYHNVSNRFNKTVLAYDSPDMFYEEKTLDLMLLFLQKPQLFIKKIMDLPAFSSKSILHVKMNQCFVPNKICKEIISQYYQYAHDSTVDIRNYLHRELEFASKKYYKYTMDVMRNPSPMLSSVITHYYIKNNKKRQYLTKVWPELCKEISALMFSPLVDLFFLFTNWKQTNSILSCYIAGLEHTSTLYAFLVEYDYYKSQFYFGDETLVNERINNINKLKKCIIPSFIYKNRTFELKRCIQLNEKVNIDNIILNYYHSQKYTQKDTQKESIIQSFTSQQNLIQERIKCLSYNRYIHVLQGQLLTDQDISECISVSNYKSKESFLQACKFNVMYIPTEYASKNTLH